MNMWDERYNIEEYVYGTAPNNFLATVIKPLTQDKTSCGSNDNLPKILSLAEGEGRNAVYLAQLGYDVTATDASIVGLEKARKLASQNHVEIKTLHADLAVYYIEPNSWDGIICCYGHFPPELSKMLFANCLQGLKKDGFFVMEAFSKDQLNYSSGGPKLDTLLYNLDELKTWLGGLSFQIATTEIIHLQQGLLHSGEASVVRIFGHK